MSIMDQYLRPKAKTKEQKEEEQKEIEVSARKVAEANGWYRWFARNVLQWREKRGLDSTSLVKKGGK